jgi:3',5'-cyclic AMP phosphodiesterase CpdA
MNKRLAKFALLTDLHLGPRVLYSGIHPTKTGGANIIMSCKAEEVLAELVSQINQDESIECTIQLGDLIQDEVFAPSTDSDLKSLDKAKRLLTSLRGPSYNVLGNHDTVNISPQRFISELGHPAPFYYKSLGAWSLIVLFSANTPSGSIEVCEDQLNWLEETLAEHANLHPEVPVVVFVHHSLACQELLGNYWFEGRAEKALINNRKQVREILEKSGCVRAVFNGHMHWDNVSVHNGIPYITVRSPVDNVGLNSALGDTPAKTYAVAELCENNLTLEYKGYQPRLYKFQLDGSFLILEQ